MSERKVIESQIEALTQTCDKCCEEISALEARLAALPPEPVRLRVEDSFILAGEDPIGHGLSVACVYDSDCARHNIDPAALAAHICTFGQPAPEAIPAREMEALRELERSAKEYTAQMNLHGFATMKHAESIRTAYRALDAAREGGGV